MSNLLPNNVTVLATDENELDLHLNGAKVRGMNVAGTNVWKGVVPPDSFVEIAPGVSMSTPEYMAFRKANQLDHDDAVPVMCELLTRYTTSVTNPNFGWNEITRRDEPHTTIERMVAYLCPVLDTEEGWKAMEVLHDALRVVEDYQSTCELAYRSFGAEE